MSTEDVDRRLSPLPESGYVYRTGWRVATGDVGDDLNLRLDGVARYIQEVGAENLVDAGEAGVELVAEPLLGDGVVGEVPVGAQPLGHERGDALLVLDDQDPGHSSSSVLSRS